MTEMSKDNKSKALPKALVDDEEEGVANAAAGKDEQPKPRNYKWLAVFFMSVALVSVATNAGLTIAIVTKSVGAYTQKHVYAVSLTSRPDKEPLQRKASFDGRGLGWNLPPCEEPCSSSMETVACMTYDVDGSYYDCEHYDYYDREIYYDEGDDTVADYNGPSDPSSDEPDEPEDDFDADHENPDDD